MNIEISFKSWYHIITEKRKPQKTKEQKKEQKTKTQNRSHKEIRRQGVTADANARGGARELPKSINDNIRTDG